MAASEAKSQAALGFLTVLEHEQQGLVGGYLILNMAGRPLEFHCTAPVKPSRAQQILFGPTLLPYLYGEQIGQTLLAKGSVEPLAVCTNVELVLSVRPFVEMPVALVLAQVVPAAKQPPAIGSDTSSAGPPSAPAGHSVWRCDRPHTCDANLNTFHVGRNHLAVLAQQGQDRGSLEQRLKALADFDLSEPFIRIQEAVEEAHKVGRG